MNASKNEFHLTAEGLQALKDELHELTTTKRGEIAGRLKEAKADGDLSENAMYDAARDEQRLVEGEQQYVIVGSTEANPDEGKISDQSPIGKALLGRKPGDEVHVDVPSGTMVYRIKHIW